MLEALAAACAAGARRGPACAVIGISPRTIDRWQRRPGGGDQRCGPRRRPANALTGTEEAQLLAIMTSPQYGLLSPKQLVPRLADDGIYLASESTMYRLQRRWQLASRPVRGGAYVCHARNARPLCNGAESGLDLGYYLSPEERQA